MRIEVTAYRGVGVFTPPLPGGEHKGRGQYQSLRGASPDAKRRGNLVDRYLEPGTLNVEHHA